jgi:hypothetical protein
LSAASLRFARKSKMRFPDPLFGGDVFSPAVRPGSLLRAPQFFSFQPLRISA